MREVVEKLHEHDVKIEKLIFYQGDELHRDQMEDLIQPCQLPAPKGAGL